MNLRSSIKTALNSLASLSLLALGAGSAMAEPIRVEATGIPMYLNSGSHQGSFVPLLPKNFTINALQFSFLFVDDGDDIRYTTTGTLQRSAPVAVREKVDFKTYKETVTTTITMPRSGVGEQETVKLVLGAMSFSGATSTNTSNVTTPTNTIVKSAQVRYVKENNEKVSCTEKQWDKGNANCLKIISTPVDAYENAIATTDYTGEIVLGSVLPSDSAAYAALARDRKLDFSIDVLGDLNLLGATLDIDYTALDDMVAVSEPASASLLGIALLGMAGVRRKRRA